MELPVPPAPVKVRSFPTSRSKSLPAFIMESPFVVMSVAIAAVMLLAASIELVSFISSELAVRFMSTGSMDEALFI